MSTYNKIEIPAFIEDQLFSYQDANDIINNINYIIERFDIEHDESSGYHDTIKLPKRVCKIKFTNFVTPLFETVFSQNMSLSSRASAGKFLFAYDTTDPTDGDNESGIVSPVAGTSSNGNVNQCFGIWNKGDASEGSPTLGCTATLYEDPEGDGTFAVADMDMIVVVWASTQVLG